MRRIFSRGENQTATHGGDRQHLIALDAATNFNGLLYVWGWFHMPGEQLASVTLEHPDIMHGRYEVGLDHGGVRELGPDKGFRCQILKHSDSFPTGAKIHLKTASGVYLEKSLDHLMAERLNNPPTNVLHDQFFKQVTSGAFPRILDIGGRARSQVDRSGFFPKNDVTVLDIVPDDNVDVVGDAHHLSELFLPDSFDAVYCVSVFEHLLMPWKVVLEINRVLRPGGIAFIHTHQTIGMHDIPWDFWRFSDSSWDALFNQCTGFRIYGRAMAHEQFILPFLWRPDKADAEKSAGFESSSIFVEKIGPSTLNWPVALRDIIDSQYPTD